MDCERVVEAQAMSTKFYLGDGVYIDVDQERYALVLTTENGIRATNTIYLEPETYAALCAWVKRLQQRGEFPKTEV